MYSLLTLVLAAVLYQAKTNDAHLIAASYLSILKYVSLHIQPFISIRRYHPSKQAERSCSAALLMQHFEVHVSAAFELSEERF